MAPDEPKAKKAVALLYDRATGAAPKVVASGAGLTAERIIAAAREAGVHITEDADLVELLARIRWARPSRPNSTRPWPSCSPLSTP